MKSTLKVVIIHVLFLHDVINCFKICIPVYLTVSFFGSNSNFLQLNWDNDCNKGTDWIGLFKSNPNATSGVNPIFRIDVHNHPNKTFRTNHAFNVSNSHGDWNKNSIKNGTLPKFGPQCLPFWIASYKNDTIQHVNCLKIEPTWMSDNLEYLEKIPFSSLFIPGTHNSGLYFGNKYKVKKDWKSNIDQSEDIWTQLVFGIRYLHLKLLYRKPVKAFLLSFQDVDYERRFWAYKHDHRVTRLLDIIRDIRTFLDATQKEVVILDIHKLSAEFYPNGVAKPKRHRKLLNLLFNEFNDVAVDYQQLKTEKYNFTFKDVVDSGKRLIICYPEYFKNITWLWPPLPHKETNTCKTWEAVASMRTTLIARQISRNHTDNPFWTMMTNLTPSISCKMNQFQETYLLNKEITIETSELWWRDANIIASDFFLENNLIDICIRSLPKKASNYTLDVIEK